MPVFNLFTLTLTIHYPSDMDRLTCWSKRLFAAYYAAGLASAAALVAGIWTAIAGQPLWLVIGLFAAWIVFSFTGLGLERLVSEVDNRRCALVLQAQHADQA